VGGGFVRIHHEGTKGTKEGIRRKGAKDAKAGFARIKTFESCAK
jgi:hypothetical protein